MPEIIGKDEQPLTLYTQIHRLTISRNEGSADANLGNHIQKTPSGKPMPTSYLFRLVSNRESLAGEQKMIVRTDICAKDGLYLRDHPRRTHQPGQMQPPIFLSTNLSRHLFLIHHLVHHRLDYNLGHRLLLCSPVPMCSRIRLRLVRLQCTRLAQYQSISDLLFSHNIRCPCRHHHTHHPNPVYVAASYGTLAKDRHERHLRARLLVSWNLSLNSAKSQVEANIGC